MQNIATVLLTLGGLLLVGLATDALGRHTPLPRVTLLLLFGFGIGPSGLDMLPDVHGRWFPILADMALLMIGFLLGERLVRLLSGRLARGIIIISLCVVLVPSLVVALGLWLLDVEPTVALLLGGIAAATAPLATTDVIDEIGAKGPFTSMLQGVVALDDAWGLIAFSLLLAAALVLGGQGAGWEVLWIGVREVGGALVLGLCLGMPMAYLTGRIRPGRPTLAEALGFVFLCGGLAELLHVSFLLAAMVMGAVVYRLASHHLRPFHEIEHIDWPFMILFFVLAGAALEWQSLLTSGHIGIAYILLRILGKLAGARLGARLSGATPAVRQWLGPALLPQAGVAVGMALIAAQRFPDHADTILAIAIGATVFFELIGPILSRYALIQTGEARAGPET